MVVLPAWIMKHYKRKGIPLRGGSQTLSLTFLDPLRMPGCASWQPAAPSRAATHRWPSGSRIITPLSADHGRASAATRAAANAPVIAQTCRDLTLDQRQRPA